MVTLADRARLRCLLAPCAGRASGASERLVVAFRLVVVLRLIVALQL